MTIKHLLDRNVRAALISGVPEAVEDYGFNNETYRYRMQLDGGAATANDIRYKLHYIPYVLI